MSRYLGPKCRLCRKERTKLFLRGERCNSLKCPLEKKGAVPPGEHHVKTKAKISGYKEQLREKQKTRNIYGVSERQMKNYFLKAKKEKSGTGKALLRLMESRLDNAVFRLGFAPSRATARQIISHRHVLVNGRKVNISSFKVRTGDVITFSSKLGEIPQIKQMQAQKDFKPPSWLERKGGAGKVLSLPSDEDLPNEINDQLIIEFYSR